MEHPYRAPQPIEKEWRPLSEGVKIGIVVTIAAVLFTGYVAYDQLFRARLPMGLRSDGTCPRGYVVTKVMSGGTLCCPLGADCD